MVFIFTLGQEPEFKLTRNIVHHIKISCILDWVLKGVTAAVQSVVAL